MVNMKTSSEGRKFIEGFEGLYLHAYNDGCDVCTIGYGHTDAAGPPHVHYGMTCTKDQADEWLAADLGKVEHTVNRLVTVPITQNQFDALVSFEFNTGALGRSRLLKDLNAGYRDRVPTDLLAWDHGHVNGQLVKIKGLTRRRQAEGQMWLGTGHRSSPARPEAPSVPKGHQAPAFLHRLLMALASLFNRKTK